MFCVTWSHRGLTFPVNNKPNPKRTCGLLLCTLFFKGHASFNRHNWLYATWIFGVTVVYSACHLPSLHTQMQITTATMYDRPLQNPSFVHMTCNTATWWTVSLLGTVITEDNGSNLWCWQVNDINLIPIQSCISNGHSVSVSTHISVIFPQRVMSSTQACDKEYNTKGDLWWPWGSWGGINLENTLSDETFCVLLMDTACHRHEPGLMHLINANPHTNTVMIKDKLQKGL